MIRIYQLYFKEEQKQFLNPLHYHYDNTINLNPNDREYPLLKECYKISLKDNMQLWGAVSWNYKFKFSSNDMISDGYLLDHISHNPGYDVYFFNPFTNHVPIIYNVWEQGQWCHPHMITIMEQIMPLMGLNVDILYKPQTRDTICFGSMCVGNKTFWDGYFALAEKFVGSINKLDTYTKYLFNMSASYTDSKINYFSFIQERLMSLFVSQSNFKVMPFHVNEAIAEPYVVELNELKKNNRWDQWLIKRQPYIKNIYPGEKVNWAEKWLKEINPKS